MMLVALPGAETRAAKLHDPTRPAAVSAAPDRTAPSKWHLGSTLIAPARRIAIVNGKAVRVGERIDGATVIAIRAGSVRLKTGGRLMTLKLRSTTIKVAQKTRRKRNP